MLRSKEQLGGPNEAPGDAKSSGVVAAPALSSTAVQGFVALLKERGDWPAVRAEAVSSDPFVVHWIDRICGASWCSFDRAAVLMTASRSALGDARLREMGRERFVRATDSGVLAPMLRSWARTFVGDTASLVRLTPHLWRGITQGLGELRVDELGAGAARLVFTSEHPTFVGCHAWHVFLEGWASGLLALARPDGSTADHADCVEIRPHNGRVELSLAWR